ncbi:hypothetical protein [Microbacterium sp. NPDC056057]
MLLFTITWARRCARVEAEFAEWSAPDADGRPESAPEPAAGA